MSATNVARAGKEGNICVHNNMSATLCHCRLYQIPPLRSSTYKEYIKANRKDLKNLPQDLKKEWLISANL